LAQQLAPGIVYSYSNGYHVVVADLDSDSVEVRVNAPHSTDVQDKITVQAHALEEGATVAINANFFGGPLNHPCGMARGSGAQHYRAYPEPGNCVTTLGWRRAAAAIFNGGGHEGDAAYQSQYPDLTTGGGYLVHNGARAAWNSNKLE